MTAAEVSRYFYAKIPIKIVLSLRLTGQCKMLYDISLLTDNLAYYTYHDYDLVMRFEMRPTQEVRSN